MEALKGTLKGDHNLLYILNDGHKNQNPFRYQSHTPYNARWIGRGKKIMHFNRRKRLKSNKHYLLRKKSCD